MTNFKQQVERSARSLLHRPARAMRRHVLPNLLPPARDARALPTSAVRIVGLLSSASGIGKSGRLCAEVLREAGHPVSVENVARLFASDDGIGYRDDGHFVPGSVSIYHLNPPMLLPALVRSGLSRYYKSYNIGYWAWELEALPSEWIRAIEFVHAILVPSRFCQAAINRYTDKPVIVVPHPLSAKLGGAERPRWSNAGLRVVNVFRFGSSFERKNPIALVEAFRLAFDDDPHAQLILKTSDGDRFPLEMRRLRSAIGSSENIVVIDDVWPEDRVADLIGSADVYASLHRSEGFGLPLAEAIMAGKPVVATDWSGSTDFCTRETSYPVDYTLVPFHDGHGDYEQVRNARWAEPSVRHAAEQFRRIRDDYEAARKKAIAARSQLMSHIASHSYSGALRQISGESDPPLRSRAGGVA